MLDPTTIAKNIDKHRVTASDRLRALRECEFVDSPEDGYYAITDVGEAYLEGKLDASELDVNEE